MGKLIFIIYLVLEIKEIYDYKIIDMIKDILTNECDYITANNFIKNQLKLD